MRFIRCFLILFTFLGVFLSYQCKARSPGASTIPARSLDALLQDYAYRAFVSPRTGTPYDGKVPSNITGIKVSVLRLRSGSLKTRGVQSYKEFYIPDGVVVQPYVERLVFVYQNLGNWSSFFYPLPGYVYLTSVIGLLAYNAANLSGTDLPELDVIASKLPLSIHFQSVSPIPSGVAARCVWFNLDGLPEFRDLVSSNVCSTYQQGHFSIVANSSAIVPSPSPSQRPPSPRKNHASKVWKIVGIVVGGFVALLLLAFLLAWLLRYRKNRKLVEMEHRADVGESLQMTKVGNAKAPVASVTRTQPTIENEYVA